MLLSVCKPVPHLHFEGLEAKIIWEPLFAPKKGWQPKRSSHFGVGSHQIAGPEANVSFSLWLKQHWCAHCAYIFKCNREEEEKRKQ